MEDPRERLTTAISTAELERRWNAARAVMREHKIDYLVMRNDEEFLGGYVRWFSDFAARHSYPFTVIFPVDDEMTLISCGAPPPSDPFPPQWAVRGVKQRLGRPLFPFDPLYQRPGCRTGCWSFEGKETSHSRIGRQIIHAHHFL